MRTYFTILIYLQPEAQAAFHAYERKAKPLIERHGGQFELVLAPESCSGGLPRPDEIHVLSFPDASAFEAFRNDPDALALAHEREATVANAIILSGKMRHYW